ncbi:MAG: hypothetical protein R6X12_08965 [bacterium]
MARTDRETHRRAPGPGVPDVAAGSWRPSPIGPVFDWLDRNTIAVGTGALAGRHFEVTTDVRAEGASVSVAEAEVETDSGKAYAIERRRLVGQSLIERTQGRRVELWDAWVHPGLRRGGLFSLMMWVVLRELLTVQKKASFRMRMTTSVRPDAQVLLQGIGACIVGHRLGLTCDFAAETVLAGDNLVASEIVPARDDAPPGLRLTIRSYPQVLVAVALDPDTERPSTSPRFYLQLKQDPDLIRDWAQRGLLVLSNGSYSLREGGVSRFVSALALDADEAADFYRRIVPLT